MINSLKLLHYCRIKRNEFGANKVINSRRVAVILLIKQRNKKCGRIEVWLVSKITGRQQVVISEFWSAFESASRVIRLNNERWESKGREKYMTKDCACMAFLESLRSSETDRDIRIAFIQLECRRDFTSELSYSPTLFGNLSTRA